ncbi:hypothetical protein PF005_g33400 [Phytophthora fragariae]|uniref:Uncharacterized protein n=1 Tax=Phytophthora fragariae TaxID=53985 RepID=A0A6A3UTA7_9STRA|nr:hypothetical protein PF005_g33400 [Phytophthora fragariae]KAE9154880.1 hypothetical protein PF004_g32759 [Phytophthora fragariae]KAE9157370.1 hypothetical protein PF002_g33383 [Phytophthora fragariae]
MLYSTKRLRIEKETMNSSVNKEKRKTFVAELNKHIKKEMKVGLALESVL